MADYTVCVITVSDKCSTGEREDASGPALVQRLLDDGWNVVHTGIVPDDADKIAAELIMCSDKLNAALVVTTGGTGFSQRDITPEATKRVIEREIPGIPEVMRAESVKITPRGMLSRAVAGIRGGTLIINVPGSVNAAVECLDAVRPALKHAVEMLQTEGSSRH